MSSSSQNITIIGLSLIIIYSITQILNFYGIGPDVYGIYVLFYLFILLSWFILPNAYPTV